MSDSPHVSESPVAVRRAATVAVLADATDGLRVLLLRRAASHVFGAGADVYPGGAVDAADDEMDATPGTDAAFRQAAIRECFEEAGLLVALADGPRVNTAEQARLRRALCANSMDWSHCIEALGVRFAPARLLAFANWTTPVGAPKRYATQFYAVAAPAGQIARADGDETVAAAWVTPTAALAEARAGTRYLMTPTQATLQQLAGFATVADALAGLAGPDENDKADHAD